MKNLPDAAGGCFASKSGRALLDDRPCDLVALLVLPDDETLASLLLQVGSAGNVRSTSMRAFEADEMGSIIARTA